MSILTTIAAQKKFNRQKRSKFHNPHENIDYGVKIPFCKNVLK